MRKNRATDDAGHPNYDRAPGGGGAVPLPRDQEYGPKPSGRDAQGHQPQRGSRAAKPIPKREGMKHFQAMAFQRMMDRALLWHRWFGLR